MRVLRMACVLDMKELVDWVEKKKYLEGIPVETAHRGQAVSGGDDNGGRGHDSFSAIKDEEEPCLPLRPKAS